MELLPAALPPHVFPIGRLDRDTEGLLLFTNDGRLAHRIAHPRYEIDKEYYAEVDGSPAPGALERLRRGVEIEGGHRTAPARVSATGPPRGYTARDGHAWLRIVIHEGRKRQVRLMCAAVGHQVRFGQRGRASSRGAKSKRSRRRSACRTPPVLYDDMPERDSPHPPRARTIAIDGPAASGKSVVGTRVASVLRYRFVDTGAMYRAVTWMALCRRVDVHDAAALSALAADARIDVREGELNAAEPTIVVVDGDDATPHLRDAEVDANVSFVSRVPGVRAALVRIQRQLGGAGRIVMAGRDIGTVVLPDAHLKVYLEASARVRAMRRAQQLAAAGIAVDVAALEADLARRDGIDSTREASPLTAATDAVIIHTDDVTIDEVVARIVELAS
jgi:cytidylate kinase